MAIPNSDFAAWVKTWKEAAPRLAAIRTRDLRALRDTDIPLFIASMNDAFVAASARDAPTSSGLVDQQRCFGRFAERPSE